MLGFVAWRADAASEVLFHQDPANDDAFLGSSWHAPDGSDEDQFVWEDIRLERGGSIAEVRWYGGYGAPPGGGESAAVGSFTLSIFPSAEGGSQPELRGAALKVYSTRNNAAETLVGTAGGAGLYEYRFVLPEPFAARPGVIYWLQIEATQTGTPTWGLARATSGDDKHFRRLTKDGDRYFQLVPGDAALSLIGTATPATAPQAAPVGVPAGPAVPAPAGAVPAPAAETPRLTPVVPSELDAQ